VKRVTLIVGLPGSGKTHLAIDQYFTKDYAVIFIDDPKVVEDITDSLKRAETHGNTQDIVVCDPNLVFPGNVEKATALFNKFGYSVDEVIYFENDPEKAEFNCRRREAFLDKYKPIEKRGPINILHFSQNYVIPKDVIPRPIYCPERERDLPTDPSEQTSNTRTDKDTQ